MDFSIDVSSVLPAGVRVTEVVPRTSGALSTVWEVRLADGAPLIVKQYADRWRWKQAKEAYVYGLLADLPALPSVVRLDAERAVTVLTLVPGTPLSQTTLPPDAERDLFRQVGVIARAIHSVRQAEFGYLTTRIVDPERDNTAYMSRQFDKKLAEFTDLGGSPGTARRVSERLAADSDLFAWCAGAHLCHNDLHAGNVLVAPDGHGWRVTGIVDVENAIAADPLMDLAKTLQYESRHRSAGVLSGLLEGYGDLPGDAHERIALYRLYHALELWDWFASNGTTDPLDSIEDDIRQLAG
ncbi:aminoglycoside phosphotransferase family protein [Antribacter sp. KLBMP9083]|uniref:Aminoglycoside phosphotransferase family protein n=1 Tax=Antribacter soli TaxID=2910976 RepID=A0AA41U780_9MICO|nr:aminoglycoside phosphotransferase family protein [Antribacter soli]MCF4121065.1 aminoglycoside phosphotransferase family protein [Antribacter soli]